DRAKAILEEEGVTDLSLDFVLVSGDSAHDQIGVLVKDQLAKVGVNVNLVKMEGGQQWDALIAGEYDIGVMWWVSDIFDPDQKAQLCGPGDPENRSYDTNYKNPRVTELVNAAAGVLVVGVIRPVLGIAGHAELRLLVGIEDVVDPPHDADVVFARNQSVPLLAALQLHQVDVDADLGELVLHQNADLVVGGIAGHQHEVEAEI